MNNLRKWTITLWAVIVLCICFLSFPAFGESAYTVTASDAVQGMDTICVGDEFDIDVSVSGAAFNGMEARIEYDSSIIRLQSVTGVAEYKESAGIIELQELDYYGWQSGKVVATLHFKAIAGGIADVKVAYATAGDYNDFKNRDAKPAEVVNDCIKVESSEITVSFRLIGDWKHGGGVKGHAEYVTWIATKEYTIMQGDTVYSVFMRAISENGMDEQGALEGYVRYIKAPDILGGYWLGEFDNGPNSGWMYTVNGVHIPNRLTEYDLKDGDSIVWHYCDDYEMEVQPSSEYYQSWLEAANISPENYVLLNLDKIVTILGDGEYKPCLDISHIGTDVRFTFTPAEGWVLKSVKVDGQSKGAISSYIYENLAITSRIQVEFVEASAFELSFLDVTEEQWFYDDVYYAVSHGLLIGIDEYTFSPNGPMTRGMLVTVLHRLEGKPYVGGDSVFTDVESGQWYTEAIVWATGHGIVKGYGNGMFGPNDYVTREQIAAILYRYANYRSYDTTARANLSGYTDAEMISGYAFEPISWANAKKLIIGRSATTLDPLGTATRAEVAAILHRFVEII